MIAGGALDLRPLGAHARTRYKGGDVMARSLFLLFYINSPGDACPVEPISFTEDMKARH